MVPATRLDHFCEHPVCATQVVDALHTFQRCAKSLPTRADCAAPPCIAITYFTPVRVFIAQPAKPPENPEKPIPVVNGSGFSGYGHGLLWNTLASRRCPSTYPSNPPTCACSTSRVTTLSPARGNEKQRRKHQTISCHAPDFEPAIIRSARRLGQDQECVRCTSAAFVRRRKVQQTRHNMCYATKLPNSASFR